MARKFNAAQTITDLLPRFGTQEGLANSLRSERSDILRQMKREIHTRGNTVQRRMDQIDEMLALLPAAT